MCHGRLIILMISDSSSVCFPPYFRHTDFTVIIVGDGDLIFFGPAITVTVCANAQLVFPLSL